MMRETLLWVILGVVLVNGLFLLQGRRARYRFLRRAGLDPARVPQERILAWLTRRRRAAQTGGTLGALPALGWALLVTEGPYAGLGPLLALAGTLLGVAVALLLSALRGAPAPPADAPRVARSSAPALADYVPTSQLVLARLGTALGVAAAVALTVASASGVVGVRPTDLPVLLSGLVALGSVVTLVLWELLGRRVVGTGQPAAGTEELITDDALRSANLRDAVWGPLASSVATVGIALGVAVQSSTGLPWSNLVVGAGGLAFGALVAALAVAAVVMAAGRPESHYRRRLWPASDRTGGTAR